jgi:hypothetical protein
MPSMKSSEVEDCLRRCLLKKGFSLNETRKNGETGVDILATWGEEKVHIEVIGYKESGPARAKDFFEAFFRAVSRLKDGASCCVIALSKLAEAGLPARAAHYGPAWERLGKAFPELRIWLVDTKADSYEDTSWNSWGSGASLHKKEDQ